MRNDELNITNSKSLKSSDSTHLNNSSSVILLLNHLPKGR